MRDLGAYRSGLSLSGTVTLALYCIVALWTEAGVIHGCIGPTTTGIRGHKLSGWARIGPGRGRNFKTHVIGIVRIYIKVYNQRHCMDIIKLI